MNITGQTAAEIFDSVRQLVHAGCLPPGEALPPVRQLASVLGVNRNTVASAYRRLVAAGVAVTRGRHGTLIRSSPQLPEHEGRIHDALVHDLGSGNPAVQWLPDPIDALASAGYRPVLYGDAAIAPVLAQQGRAWFDADSPGDYQVQLTHGAVDALERLLGSGLTAGDRVAIEEPCYLSGLRTVLALALEPVGVAVDAFGMQPAALQQALEAGAQAVVITPRAHNPTGASLSGERAAALRQVLKRFPHVLVIEDDHFALLAQARYYPVIPARMPRWARIRSVSKALGPDLRLAIVASDPDTAQQLSLRLARGNTWVSHLLQQTVAACLASPAVLQQVQAAGADYASRRAALVAALSRRGLLPWLPAEGLNLWLPVPVASQPLAERLLRRGWWVRAGEVFALQQPVQALRITIATLAARDAERLAEDIVALIEDAG